MTVCVRVCPAVIHPILHNFEPLGAGRTPDPNPGSAELWICWITWLSDYLAVGLLGCRITSLSDHFAVGSLRCRITSLSGLFAVGSLRCRILHFAASIVWIETDRALQVNGFTPRAPCWSKNASVGHGRDQLKLEVRTVAKRKTGDNRGRIGTKPPGPAKQFMTS